jgi:hypothetical protein
MRSRHNFTAVGGAALLPGLDERLASAPGRLCRRQRCAAQQRRRAATRGRGAAEGEDEHPGVKSALFIRPPASRTGSYGENRDPAAATRPPYARSKNPSPGSITRFLRPAPLIDERAATRGGIATERGDEQAGAKRRYPFELQNS